MEEKEKKPSPSWKLCVGFGIMNLIFVLLANTEGILWIYTTLLLLLGAGIITSVQSIVKDIKNRFKKSAALCLVGLLLNISAAVLYVMNIISNFNELFGISAK